MVTAPGAVADAFSQVSRGLDHEKAHEQVLVSATRAGVAICSGPVQSSVTLAGPGAPRTVAASGELAARVDQTQYATGVGPCLTAALERTVVCTPDLLADARWAAMRARATDTGARAILSVPMDVPVSPGRHLLGALNVVSTAPDVFDTATQDAMVALAAHVTAILGVAVRVPSAPGDTRHGPRADETGRVVQTLDALARGQLGARLDPAGTASTPLAEAVNSLARAVELRLEAAEDFSAALAHELTPRLTVLGVSLEVLHNERGHLTRAGREALDLLTDEVAQERRLAAELVALTRARAAQSAARGPIVLGRAVEGIVEHLQPGLPVVVPADARDVRAGVDPRLLRRVLRHLLDNAAVHAGGATRVLVAVSGDSARVVVEDAGPGVPPDHREEIFRRFATLHYGSRDSRPKALGLGLALARQYARTAGGDLRVESRTDRQRGAAFVVTLPVVPSGELPWRGS